MMNTAADLKRGRGGTTNPNTGMRISVPVFDQMPGFPEMPAFIGLSRRTGYSWSTESKAEGRSYKQEKTVSPSRVK